jgi:hypothetical protein
MGDVDSIKQGSILDVRTLIDRAEGRNGGGVLTSFYVTFLPEILSERM